MFKENKISTATKMIILFIYTFLMFAIAITVISAASLNETKGYNTETKDKNIQVVAELIESRTAGNLTDSTKKENSKWKINFQVSKHNPDVKVEDIIIYAKGKTEEGEEIYFESSKGTPSKNGTSFLTFPKYSSSGTQIEKTNVYKTSAESYTKTNSLLSIVYVDIMYKVDGEHQEFKFYIVPAKSEHVNFNSFVKEIELTENKEKRIVYNANGYTTVSVTPTMANKKTTPEETTNDEILFELKANEQLIKEDGLYVVDANVTMFAKVKNDYTDTEQYFADYIVVTDLHGTFVDDSDTKAWSDRERLNLSTFYTSTSSINSTYDVSELYLIISYTTSDGKTHTDQLKINLNIN